METISVLLAICAGNSPITGEFSTQNPVMRSFDVFFDLRLNQRLSKQSWGWWFETPSHPLWRHCNEWRPFCLGLNVLIDSKPCMKVSYNTYSYSGGSSTLDYHTYSMDINSLAPVRCGSNLKSVIFKCIMQRSSLVTSCEMALRWTPQYLTNDNSRIVQVMVWKGQATSHYLSQCWP